MKQQGESTRTRCPGMSLINQLIHCHFFLNYFWEVRLSKDSMYSDD
jgi:hypothetical protein